MVGRPRRKDRPTKTLIRDHVATSRKTAENGDSSTALQLYAIHDRSVLYLTYNSSTGYMVS